MPLKNFSLLSSIWGASAMITCVEFHEVRKGKRSTWQALIVARDGQMYFSDMNGEPRRWASLDRAVRELGLAVPALAEMKVVRAVSRSANRCRPCRGLPEQ
jgi:hypothetical protein